MVNKACRCVTANTAMLSESHRTAGECASNAGGTPQVRLHCPPRHLIHVRRSFHGARASTGDRCLGHHGAGSNCTYCPGDCIDETAGIVYDWTACTGREACSRTVLQSLMPHCSRQQHAGVTTRTESSAETPGESETNDVAAHSATWEHFSDYINVDYDCINRTNGTTSHTALFFFSLNYLFLPATQYCYQLSVSV